MNLMEYVQELIQNGTWGKLSGDAHSIFIYIIAKSKNQPIQLSYTTVASDLGIAVNTAKKHIQILVEEGLILHDPAAGTYKPAVEIDNAGAGLPLPPTIPNQEADSGTDIFKWAQEFILSPWGALIGGAVIGYIIRLWVEYLQSQQEETEPLPNLTSFVQPNPFPNLRLEEARSWWLKNSGK